MWTEPAFSRYEVLLKRLHGLNMEGKLDSSEADSIRADMDGPWPPEVVAYMRGRCWQQLGRPEAAFWFFDHAQKLALSNRH